jgi:hypothetical protein
MKLTFYERQHISTISCPSQRTHASFVCTHVPDPYATISISTDSYVPVKSRGWALMPFVTPHPLWPWSFLCTFYPHVCAPGKTSRPVTHPEIAPSQAHLSPKFFAVGLPEKKVYVGGMSTPSILLELEPGCHMAL